jgi:hypothetical protein
MGFGLSFHCLSSRKNLMSLRSSSSRQVFRFSVVTSQNSQFPEFLTINLTQANRHSITTTRELHFRRRRTYMVRRFFILVLTGAVFSIAPVVKAQKGSAENQRAKGVPEQYAGNWVCQTYMPGYNIFLPNADMSQPQTNKTTTPSSVAVLKFSLRSDGVYEAPNAK